MPTKFKVGDFVTINYGNKSAWVNYIDDMEQYEGEICEVSVVGDGWDDYLGGTPLYRVSINDYIYIHEWLSPYKEDNVSSENIASIEELDAFMEV